MKITKNLSWWLSLALLIVSVESHSQDGFSDFIKQDIQETEKLLEAYLNPFMKATNLGLNQGWYNTAKTHKFFGCDVTTSISFMTIPQSEMFYDVSALKLNHFSLDQSSPDHPLAPTILGPDRTPIFNYTNEQGEVEQFEGPPGADLEGELKMAKLPVPMINVGFSLPKDFDVKLRFAPTVKLGSDGEFKFWGIGVMHNIKQYFPGIKLAPFDLAGFIGHTQMEITYTETSGDTPGENQHGVMKMSATTIQAVISKKISVITFYGGAGFNIANSNLDIKGSYDIDDDGDVTPDLVDPVSMKFAASGARLTGGMRLKLAVFTLHADYTLQKYNALNVGFGVSIR